MKFKLLEIDLTLKKIEMVDVTQDMELFIGGRGLGAKLLWDRLPPNIDPLEKENILYFGIGPCTGFFGSVTNVSSKSPLTLLRGHSNLNGNFGRELRNAGYNGGLLLKGKSETPVYIYIKNETVEIRDASHIWGKYNIETQIILNKEVKKIQDDQNFAIASIGPAGENMVRNAGISHDFIHHAARLGMGAVMGSKNVKAITVRGTQSPDFFNHQGIFNILEKFTREGRSYQAEMRRWGHTSTIPQRFHETREGVKNKQLGWHEVCDLSNPLIFEQKYKLWNDSCSLCPIGCQVPYMNRGAKLGPVVGQLRHDNTGGWNANVLLKGYEEQTYLTPLLDELGLDSEDVSGVVAWLMECYEKGIIDKHDLDGIELNWGDLEAICRIVKKIAYRDGVGDILAEGLKFAPEKLNPESRRYAMTKKGLAITSYEPRGSMYDAIGLAINPTGEQHGDRGAPWRILFDSLTACTFLKATLVKIFGNIEDWTIDMLRVTSGWELSTNELKKRISRALIMERCYSLREGYIPSRDDLLPERFFNETIYNKYGKPKILDKKEFLTQREKAYCNRGLTKEGLPDKTTLIELGLDYVIPELFGLSENKEK